MLHFMVGRMLQAIVFRWVYGSSGHYIERGYEELHFEYEHDPACFDDFLVCELGMFGSIKEP